MAAHARHYIYSPVHSNVRGSTTAASAYTRGIPVYGVARIYLLRFLSVAINFRSTFLAKTRQKRSRKDARRRPLSNRHRCCLDPRPSKRNRLYLLERIALAANFISDRAKNCGKRYTVFQRRDLRGAGRTVARKSILLGRGTTPCMVSLDVLFGGVFLDPLGALACRFHQCEITKIFSRIL